MLQLIVHAKIADKEELNAVIHERSTELQAEVADLRKELEGNLFPWEIISSFTYFDLFFMRFSKKS